jgi:hypothetical protein
MKARGLVCWGLVCWGLGCWMLSKWICHGKQQQIYFSAVANLLFYSKFTFRQQIYFSAANLLFGFLFVFSAPWHACNVYQPISQEENCTEEQIGLDIRRCHFVIAFCRCHFAFSIAFLSLPCHFVIAFAFCRWLLIFCTFSQTQLANAFPFSSPFNFI